MKSTILIAISEWAVKNLNIKESLKNVSISVLQKCLWEPLQNRLIKFFSSEEKAQKFVECISTEEAINERKPQRDIEDTYEELEDKVYSKELFDEIVAFFSENQSLIHQINQDNAECTENNVTFVKQKATNIYNSVGGKQEIHINNNSTLPVDILK